MLQLKKHTLLHKIKHNLYSTKLYFIMIKFKTVSGIDVAQVNATLHALVVCPALSFLLEHNLHHFHSSDFIIV